MSRFPAVIVTAPSEPTVPLKDLQRLTSAIHYASMQHGNQRRKNKASLPYITHPLEVMNLLSQAGTTDVDVLIAGVCHDLTEDVRNPDGSEKSRDDLIQVIGARAAGFVFECTDDKKLTKVQRKQLQLEHASTASFEAKCVKLGDKLSNTMGIKQDSPFEKVEERGYLFWTLAIVRACGDIHPIYSRLIQLLRDDHNVEFTTEQALQTELTTYYKNIDESD